MEEKKVHSTKLIIMDAAERLFAAHGFGATSLRAITSEAGVNLGAVNYHFESKDALILEVLRRRMTPINEERVAMLERFNVAAGGRPLSVETILRAFFQPVFALLTESSNGGRVFLGLIGQILAEPGAYLKPLIEKEFAERTHRFTAALMRALPDLPEEEICWRLHFAGGAFIHTVAHAQVLELASRGKCCVEPNEETLQRVIAFCAAGFKVETEMRTQAAPRQVAGVA